MSATFSTATDSGGGRRSRAPTFAEVVDYAGQVYDSTRISVKEGRKSLRRKADRAQSTWNQIGRQQMRMKTFGSIAFPSPAACASASGSDEDGASGSLRYPTERHSSTAGRRPAPSLRSSDRPCRNSGAPKSSSRNAEGGLGTDAVKAEKTNSLTPSLDDSLGRGSQARTISRSASRASQVDSRDIDEDEGLSIQSAIFLMVTAIVGCGVVALPSLMKLGGWVVPAIMAAVTSLAFMEIGTVLHSAISRCENPRVSSKEDVAIGCFEDFGRAAFGQSGALCVRAVTTTGFVGTLVVYTILISQNVYSFLNGAVSRMVTLAIVTPLLLSLAMLKDLQAMAKIMPIGVFASMTSCVLICVKAALDARLWRDRPAEERIALHSLWPEELDSLGTIIAVLFAAYSVMGTVPSIRGQMQDPHAFPTAFRTAIAVVFVVYMAVMTIGYYGYGNYVQDNVVSSMMHPHLAIIQLDGTEDHKHSKQKHAAKSWMEELLHNALGTLMAGLVSTYLLIGFALFFACVMGLLQNIRPTSVVCVPNSWQNRGLRIFLVLAVSGVGLMVPHFREVMAIMSSICCSCNNVFFPLIFAHKLESELPENDETRTSCIRRIAHVFIFLIAVYCFCMGLHDSVLKLVKEMKETHKPS